MSAMASQITGDSIVYSTVCSDADQRNHQTSSSISPIKIWPSFCFFVPSAARIRFQNRLKSRGGCATKMLRTEIIELLNASHKSTHVLCIDRKLRSFWVEWRSYHISRCSRKHILNNLIHQLHNVFSLRRTHITVHRFAIQSLIGNSGRTCTLSGCTCDCSADVFKSRNRGLTARKQWRTLHKN